MLVERVELYMKLSCRRQGHHSKRYLYRFYTHCCEKRIHVSYKTAYVQLAHDATEADIEVERVHCTLVYPKSRTVTLQMSFNYRSQMRLPTDLCQSPLLVSGTTRFSAQALHASSHVTWPS